EAHLYTTSSLRLPACWGSGRFLVLEPGREQHQISPFENRSAKLSSGPCPGAQTKRRDGVGPGRNLLAGGTSADICVSAPRTECAASLGPPWILRERGNHRLNAFEADERPIADRRAGTPGAGPRR